MLTSNRRVISNVQSPILLGLFPWIGPGNIGGVQFSGFLAWHALRELIAAQNGRMQLLCYDTSSGKQQFELPDVVIADTQLTAVQAAMRCLIRPDLLLIWHIGLLKLLPFLPTKPRRIILFLHGIEVWRRPPLLTRLLLRRVNLVLSNSAYTWQQAQIWLPELARMEHQVVHLGVENPIDSCSALPNDSPAALILGRLACSEDYKGHRELIYAWPRVLQSLHNAELWIAGDGDLRPDLEQMVQERGLEAHVRFFGRVSEEQKQELLTRCRCLAMPSRGEGFGLVYLEAMRLGRPCLVSTIDAGREVVNPPEAGLAADPSDSQSLAAALCRLMTPGAEWNRWSDQARRRYENQFTARHFQEQLVKSIFSNE